MCSFLTKTHFLCVRVRIHCYSNPFIIPLRECASECVCECELSLLQKKNWTVKHIGNIVHWWTKHFFDGLTLDSSTLIGSFRVVYAINLEENWYKHTNTYIQSFSFTQRVKWFNNLISQQPHTVQIWYREYKVLNVWIETDWT